MGGFIDGILALPTLLFTIPLGLSVLYWLLVVVGALDLDVLDGAIDGVGEALEGGLDGALEGAFDGATDALDGGLDGAAEAADGVTDLAHGGSAVLQLVSALKLNTVPLTISLSFISLFGWLFSYLAMDQVGGLIGLPTWAVAAGVGIGALIGGTMGASVAVRPMGRFFETHEGRNNRSLVGLTCTVTTGRVDATFGQADVADKGDHLLIQVRCDRAGGLRRGDSALIVQYDKTREAFIVEALSASDQPNQ